MSPRIEHVDRWHARRGSSTARDLEGQAADALDRLLSDDQSLRADRRTVNARPFATRITYVSIDGDQIAEIWTIEDPTDIYVELRRWVS